MSVLRAIDNLANAGVPGKPTITFTRWAAGHYDDNTGVWANGASVTSPFKAVVQPAFNLNRVVGGADMQGRVDLQKTTTVMQLHTRTALQTLSKDPGTDAAIPADVITYKGADWTVSRVEIWEDRGQPYYHVVFTKKTGGAA